MPAPGGQKGDQAEGDGADDERVVDAQQGSVGEVPAKRGRFGCVNSPGLPDEGNQDALHATTHAHVQLQIRRKRKYLI